MTSAVTPASDITVPTSEVGCKAEVTGAMQCRAEVDEDGVVPAGSRTIISAEDRHIWILGEVFLERDPYGGDEDYWVTLTDKPKFPTQIPK